MRTRTVIVVATLLFTSLAIPTSSEAEDILVAPTVDSPPTQRLAMDGQSYRAPSAEEHFLATQSLGDSEQVVEVRITAAGDISVSPIAHKSGITYRIETVTKTGVVVTASNHAVVTPNLTNTYLVTQKGWQSLSSKPIRVAPSVLSTNSKILYGRQLKGTLNSPNILAQDLTTGVASKIFESGKHGGGFICGVVSDTNSKYGYFTHMLAKTTDLYRIDLTTGKIGKFRTLLKGLCLDATGEGNQFVFKRVDVKTLETTSDLVTVMTITAKSIDNSVTTTIHSTVMSNFQHSFLAFGKYVISYDEDGALQINGAARETVGYHYAYIDGSSLEPITKISNLKYISPLPSSWLLSESRPDILLSLS